MHAQAGEMRSIYISMQMQMLNVKLEHVQLAKQNLGLGILQLCELDFLCLV